MRTGKEWLSSGVAVLPAVGIRRGTSMLHYSNIIYTCISTSVACGIRGREALPLSHGSWHRLRLYYTRRHAEVGWYGTTCTTVYFGNIIDSYLPYLQYLPTYLPRYRPE